LLKFHLNVGLESTLLVFHKHSIIAKHRVEEICLKDNCFGQFEVQADMLSFKPYAVGDRLVRA
jgi:hypothetical protein